MLAYFNITLDVSEQQQDRSSRCCKKAVSHTLVTRHMIRCALIFWFPTGTKPLKAVAVREQREAVCDLRTSSDCYRKRRVRVSQHVSTVLLYFVSDTCVRHTKHRRGAT